MTTRTHAPHTTLSPPANYAAEAYEYLRGAAVQWAKMKSIDPYNIAATISVAERIARIGYLNYMRRDLS